MGQEPFTAYSVLIAPIVSEPHRAAIARRYSHTRAAAFALDVSTVLPAGDALHLACAEQAGARTMAALDAVLGRNAQRLKIKLVVFS